MGAADAQTAHPATSSTAPAHQTTGLRERGNDTSRSTSSGRQKAATRRNMRREERVTVQGPVKKQQPDGMSRRGGGGVLVGPWCCEEYYTASASALWPTATNEPRLVEWAVIAARCCSAVPVPSSDTIPLLYSSRPFFCRPSAGHPHG